MTENYFHYLSKKSWKGKMYRNYYLYPFISRYFKPKDYLLDFGCGIGDYLTFRANTVGVDINDDNVKYCNQNGNIAKVIENNSIDFSDNTFDAVIMDNVLEHIPNPTESLKEITRVLNKNGLLLVGVPGEKGFDSDDDHKIFYDKEKLNTLIVPFGYQHLHTFYTPLILSSNYLSRNLRIYCLYMVFQKT